MPPRHRLRPLLASRPLVATALVVAAWLVAAVALFCRPPRMGMPDTREYEAVARLPLASARFWTANRAPGLPLLMKLCAGALDPLVWIQLALQLGGFALVAFVLARLCRRPWVRVGCVAGVLAGSFSIGFFFWSRSVLTESLSISLILWAIGLILYDWPSPRRYAWLRTFAAALALLFWAATRDANAAWLPCAALLAVAAAWIGRASARARRTTLLWVPFALVVAALSSASIDASGRWRYPLVNVIGRRILTMPARKARFERAGMPDNARVRCFAGKWSPDCGSDFAAFEPWLTTRARRDYLVELLLHPGDLLVEPFVHWRALISGQRRDERASPPLTYYFYDVAPGWQKSLSELFLADPHLFLVELGAAVALLLALARRRRLDAGLWPPAWLMMSSLPMLLLAWHGDAMEMQRHAVAGMLLLRVGLWGTTAVAIDRLVTPPAAPPAA
jgi:hypothetical protein